MKKFVIATAIVLAVTAAGAVEMGVSVGYDYAGSNRSTAGVSIGEKFGSVGVTAGVDRQTAGANDQTRYSVIADYGVANLGTAAVSLRGGAAYLNNNASRNGYAAVIGVGVRVPVTKSVALTAAVDRQFGESQVNAFNGTRFSTGLRFSF